MSLLERISAGDGDAISACLDEYGDLVWRLAHRYLNLANAEVEDAVQEVFIELWISAGRFNPARGSEASFVATVAHRRLTDCQRRVTSRRRIAKILENETPTDMKSLLSESDGDERSAKAIDALRTLPEGEREALWLWIYRGMTHRQIGEAMSSPIGTVKSRVRRGLLRLYDTVTRDIVEHEPRPEPANGLGFGDPEGGAA